MKILFLHGLESLPGGSKVKYLRDLGHDVLNPLLPKDDFEESVRIAQEEVDLEAPELIVGSSRGGAIALAIDPGRARLILIAPAWKRFEIPPSAPANTDILHCVTDDKVLFQDSEKLQGANLVPCGDDHRMTDEDALAALGRAVGGNLQAEALLREYVRDLLMEDPMGFVHDLAAASEEHGEWSWGEISKGAGRDIKRAFNKNADHQWLSSLDTVHWTDGYGLDGLTSGKDELSATMSLPGEKFDPATWDKEVGLWVKGRITLAANDQDALYTGRWDDYMGASPRSKEGKAQRHRAKSSGVNKLPTMSKDYSKYGQLKPGVEFMEKMARNIPYVLDQSTWDPSGSEPNEALVDNWRPVGIIVVDDRDGSRIKAVKYHSKNPLKAAGMVKQIFQAAELFGVPLYDVDRNELWAPGKKEVKEETIIREHISELLAEQETNPTINVQNYGNGISAVLMMSGFKIGYVTAREVLRWKYCAKDVEKLQAQGHGEPGTDPDFPTLGPNLWAVGNSQVDQGFRGLGYGKMLYKALIEEAGRQAGVRGAFVGADECAAGSTSKDAQRVWKSLARDYPSSGNVVFVGSK